jgi:RND family efflux transporter MFP subunit
VKAAREVTLTAQIPGRLTRLPVPEGSAFRSGETLAAFESPETRQAVESVRAALVSAEVRRNEARRQSARLDSLFANGVVSERQRELAVNDREAAEAGWQGATASLSRWRTDTRLSIPFDGVVVRRHVDAGALLQPGQAILDVRSTTVDEIEVAVPESEAARISSGRIQVQSGPSGWIEADVVRVDGMIDHLTRTRVAHLKPARLDGFEPGAYARVRIDTGANVEQLDIPETALVRRGSLTGVFVAENGRAWLRWIRTGRIREGRIEILAGLSPTDEIVSEPARLTDGARIRVTR